ncbi:hypothetical protein SteCoe_13604 [Stentor coeruleus]|uniref:Uncharacterized protein n=1 Tax=Stentor coeruleus TaxID=5963 RepID=A0A1R2C7Z5_9CILI|nr:hypothetical protein SteCoe_13604 [Stentor coeruleus]
MNKGHRNDLQEKTYSVPSKNIRELSGYLEYKLRKRKRLLITNHSIISTRDHSSNRNLTPNHSVEPIKSKGTLVASPKDQSIDDMMKKIESLHDFLPKIYIKSPTEKIGKNEVSFLKKDRRPENAAKIENIYLGKRSKSSLSSNQKYFPKLKKDVLQLDEMQNYINEFHNKSKKLLKQLEEKIFGK